MVGKPPEPIELMRYPLKLRRVKKEKFLLNVVVVNFEKKVFCFHINQFDMITEWDCTLFLPIQGARGKLLLGRSVNAVNCVEKIQIFCTHHEH